MHLLQYACLFTFLLASLTEVLTLEQQSPSLLMELTVRYAS